MTGVQTCALPIFERLIAGRHEVVAVVCQPDRERGRGLVVTSAPIAEVAQHHYPYVPARHLVKDRFDAVSRIASVKTPLLVLHGERDDVVPIGFGRALFEAAAEPKRGWFPADADHATIFDAEAFGVVQAFLAEHVR